MEKNRSQNECVDAFVGRQVIVGCSSNGIVYVGDLVSIDSSLNLVLAKVLEIEKATLKRYEMLFVRGMNVQYIRCND